MTVEALTAFPKDRRGLLRAGIVQSRQEATFFSLAHAEILQNLKRIFQLRRFLRRDLPSTQSQAGFADIRTRKTIR